MFRIELLKPKLRYRWENEKINRNLGPIWIGVIKKKKGVNDGLIFCGLVGIPETFPKIDTG